MTTVVRHRLRSSVAGAALGATALFLVTALLAGALAAVQANRTIDTLAHQLTDARGQIDELRKDNGRLDAQNQQLLAQNTEQHAQLDTLIIYLRRHGLAVPKIIATTPPAASTTPSGQAATDSPKAPTPSPSHPSSPHPSPAPATPAPTPTPTPPAPSPGLGILCNLTPILCTP